MKKMIKIITLVLLLVTGLLLLTGCGNEEPKIETEKLTREEYSYTVSVDVPKEKGYEFVDEVEEENKNVAGYPNFVLDGEKVQIYFENSSFVYQTSTTFKDKHPEMDEENPNFSDFVAVAYPDEEVFDLNGNKAIKVAKEYGASGNTKLVGYDYYVELSGAKACMNIQVMPTSEDADVASLMEDIDVKTIVNSITVNVK